MYVGGDDMNERVHSILKLIVKKPTIKMAELTDELSLTKRQVNYAIQQFNGELSINGLANITREHNGTFNLPLEVIHLLQSQEQQNLLLGEQDFFSDDERIALIPMYVSLQDEFISLDHLMELLHVSRNTVIEDLRKVNWFADKYSLNVSYTRQDGYFIKGLENRILQMISDLIKQTKLLRRESIKTILISHISEEEVIHLIHNMEQMMHFSYSDESFEYLLSSVRYILQRAIHNSDKEVTFFKEDLHGTPEYKFLRVLFQDTNWKLSIDYIEWISLLFLSSNISEQKTTQYYDSDQDLKILIKRMVDEFQKQTLIEVTDREVFESRILSHLRPACFRIKYRLSLGTYSMNSLIQDGNHAILNTLMKELIIPIENWIGKAFPYDELELLSYYFGIQLTNHRQWAPQKPRAVVVCANGIMVSKLMRDNLKKLFPEIQFLASFSIRDFYKFGVDYDLVFTTTQLKTNILQYVTNPIMNYKDQIGLRYRVLKDLGFSEVDQSIEDLVSIIKRYARVSDSRSLKEELALYLLQEQSNSPIENFKTLPSLTHFLKPDFIQVVAKKISWEDALTIACKPLLEYGIINERFIEDCKKQIVQKDYAGYLGQQTCIPHTTIENGVLKDGISLLVSKEPIEFPNGMNIHFVYPLSFYALTKHLRAVNQLADISNNEELLSNLVAEHNIKELYQIIRKNS